MKEKEVVEENEEEEEAVCGFILMLLKLRPSQSKFYEWISEETVGQMKEKEGVDENEKEEEGISKFFYWHTSHHIHI